VLATCACRANEELGLAHGDGPPFTKPDERLRQDNHLLILDDWGMARSLPTTRDMLELLDDRYGQRSTIVTSQMPVDNLA